MSNFTSLKENWFSDGWIDYELKKYTLLAYLKHVDEFFKDTKVYPFLSDLITHYNNLVLYKTKKQDFESRLKKEIRGIDLKKMKIYFEKNEISSKALDEVLKIIQFAKKEIKKSINQGEEIYDHLSSKMSFDTVGLIPFYNKEGYIIISRDNDCISRVYEYNYSIIQHENDIFYNLKTEKIALEFNNITTSPTSIKLSLIKHFKNLPNPATYQLHSYLNVSLEHSIIPIAKRWLLKEIATAA